MSPCLLYSFVHSVKYHPDGTCIVSGSADKSIKLWDVRSHQLIQHYPAHLDAVTSISLHPNGYYLASASKDKTLRLWDLREGRLLFTLQGHSNAINACNFSPDGNFIASGGLDKLVMVWKSNIAGVATPEIEWGQGESLKARPVPAASTIR